MMAQDRQTRLFPLSVAGGKRLIGKAVAAMPEIAAALRERTVVILGGTTNAYVAQEILASVGKAEGFDPKRFFRGITLPVGTHPDSDGRNRFAGDLVIRGGRAVTGPTIFDVVDSLKAGDVVIKGANAVNVETGQAGVLIGNEKAGTIGAILPAVVGRRVRLIVPVGLEKRVSGDIAGLAALLDSPEAGGPRLMPVPAATVVTELDAVRLLSGAQARLAAAGGVCGAEGTVWLAVTGGAAQVGAAADILQACLKEPPFTL